MNERSNSIISIPAAIIIAGAIVGIAIMWSNKNKETTPTTNIPQNEVKINIPPVTSDDHIFGNPNAKIKIVEYSDASCPFCKIFHPTIRSVMAENGEDGNVAWIYRHFPLDFPDPSGRILHPNAEKEAEAMECANELGGPTTFWDYVNRLYEVTPAVTSTSPNGLPPSELTNIADFVGISKTDFDACLASGKYEDKVRSQQTGGLNAGVSGTPASFIILSEPANMTLDSFIENARIQYRVSEQLLYVSADRKIIALNGAMPEDLVSSLIAFLLN